jgi:hypothetical protein
MHKVGGNGAIAVGEQNHVAVYNKPFRNEFSVNIDSLPVRVSSDLDGVTKSIGERVTLLIIKGFAKIDKQFYGGIDVSIAERAETVICHENAII